MKSDKPATAVQWHSTVAQSFDAAYEIDPRFQDRYSIWRDVLARLIRPEFSALDLGCGAGELLLPLSEACHTVLGIDGSPEMLQICRQKLGKSSRQNVELRQADLTGLSALELKNFHLIVASSVLEYLPDLDSSLAALYSALQPGGTLVFSIPNGSSLYRRAEPLIYRVTGKPAYFPYVVNVRTRTAMERQLKRHGFGVADVKYMSPTPGLSAIGRPLGLRAFTDNLLLLVATKN